MTGGSGSLVTLSLTRGVLSGFAREEPGWLIKTDAAIHAGVSGGACVDGAGRLVGLPSSSIADSNQAGGLGFVIPLERVPEAWRTEIEAR
jgi:S1-C subfamily serine protease